MTRPPGASIQRRAVLFLVAGPRVGLSFCPLPAFLGSAGGAPQLVTSLSVHSAQQLRAGTNTDLADWLPSRASPWMSLSHHLSIRVACKQSRWGDLRSWVHGRVEGVLAPARACGGDRSAACPVPAPASPRAQAASLPEGLTVPPAVSRHIAGCTLSPHEGFVTAFSSVLMSLHWMVAFPSCQ